MIVALCMAKNEEGIIGQVVDHLYAEGVDWVVVEDGNSTDDTRAEALKAGAFVVGEKTAEYEQSARMTALAAEHCKVGDWVIPFDADEFWYATDGHTIADALAQTTAQKLWARMYLHLDWDRRLDGHKPLPKVAFRYQPGTVIAWGNHDVNIPGGEPGVLDLREWQYRSFDHMLLKVQKQRELLANTPNLDRQYGYHRNVMVEKTLPELEEAWARYCAEGEWIVDPIPSRA